LTPPYPPAHAARLAVAALADTLAAVAQAAAQSRVIALDGAPGPWVPPGFVVVPQGSGSLDVRIAAVLAGVTGPVAVVGMDTPQVTAALLHLSWARHDAWLGPALDGGFWLLGLAVPDPALVRGIAMSRPDTGAHLLARLHAARLRVGRLPVLRDVDTAADADAVAALAPTTRFAAVHAELAASSRLPALTAARPGSAALPLQ
jgi:glycosyltransferase A (GT-A) superfamily protein (DUF2064 family)